MWKPVLALFMILGTHCILSGVSPEDYLKQQKRLYEQSVKAADKEMTAAERARDKEILDATKSFYIALEKAKVYWTKKGEIEMALGCKKQQDALKTTLDQGKAKRPPKVKEEVKEPVAKKPPSVRKKETVTAAGSMKLEDAFKELSMADHGFTLSDSSMNGTVEPTQLGPFLSKHAQTFNGKCEYSYKVKSRWYHGVVLKIGGKEYSMSYGHWANNGARIIVGDDEVLLKGKGYKTARDASEKWNEVKILIDDGRILYKYNGETVHKAEVTIPKNSTLYWGVSSYRTDIGLKDFSLTLK